MYFDLNCIIEPVATLISLTFISGLIAITIYKLILSWDYGKERYLANEENKRIEALNKKRLENLKLENLEIKLTNEDIELLNQFVEKHHLNKINKLTFKKGNSH